MSVNKSDRRQSKVEFDNNFFNIHDDAVKLIENYLGANEESKQLHQYYIRSVSATIYKTVMELGTYIRIANSIYPVYQSELEERRLAQDKAIGLCFDLLTKYQLAMHTLKVKDDKYTVEIKHIIHEINCIKKWRMSDSNRFKNLG